MSAAHLIVQAASRGRGEKSAGREKRGRRGKMGGQALAGPARRRVECRWCRGAWSDRKPIEPVLLRSAGTADGPPSLSRRVLVHKSWSLGPAARAKAPARRGAALVEVPVTAD